MIISGYITYAKPFPILIIINNITFFCVKQEIIVNNVSIPIDPKITNRLPLKSPKNPQKYAPSIIPEKITFDFKILKWYL